MEEIIIDGVDVAGCIYYNAEKLANCGMFAQGDFKCEGQICLYKQLKRLEQENTRLKEEIEIRDNLSEKFRKEALSWANIANGCQKDKTKLKQTLQDIKDIAEFHITDDEGRSTIGYVPCCKGTYKGANQ